MAEPAHYVAYQFGSFTLDLQRGALLAADGKEKPLRPKSSTLLRLLVENAGCLLSKEAIMEAVWPDIFVTENSITQCIHEIRAALGSEAHEAVHTCARRGYRFTSNVIGVLSPKPSSRSKGSPELVNSESALVLSLGGPLATERSVSREESRLHFQATFRSYSENLQDVESHLCRNGFATGTAPAAAGDGPPVHSGTDISRDKGSSHEDDLDYQDAENRFDQDRSGKLRCVFTPRLISGFG